MNGLYANKKKRGRIYLLVFKKEQPLSDGFRYIKEMIYNQMNVKMYDLYQKCKNNNLDVVGIRTDAILVNNSESEINQRGCFNFENKLGGLKRTWKDMCRYTYETN